MATTRKPAARKTVARSKRKTPLRAPKGTRKVKTGANVRARKPARRKKAVAHRAPAVT